jgi:hypothetical protein
MGQNRNFGAGYDDPILLPPGTTAITSPGITRNEIDKRLIDSNGASLPGDILRNGGDSDLEV